ncbi:MAG: GNAT family N-acetyltransferase [Cyclobacteriaceae bacterium]|nr:GNAT family N-acetyltransferase [Cyclobacteriaceae bacterium]
MGQLIEKFRVEKISAPEKLQLAFKIRHTVFVNEQGVPANEEMDAFENSSEHFLAFDDEGKAIGTARWRKTEAGCKLERFAVLREYRKNGIGGLLVEAVKNDIQLHDPKAKMYLHAQVTAIDFYEKYGFIKSGDSFDECGIWHYKMWCHT